MSYPVAIVTSTVIVVGGVLIGLWGWGLWKMIRRID